MKRWFQKLKVGHKLLLISIFFVLPNVFMLYLYLDSIDTHLRFADLELKGNAYLRALELPLKLISQNRLLTQRAIEGDASVQPEIAENQARIDHAFDDLTALDARIGPELQFTPEGLARHHREHLLAHTLRAEWQDLKSQTGKLNAEVSADRHEHLMDDLRQMISYIGDTSNLSLDEDLDSGYLMDAVVLALPQTQVRIGAVLAYGETALRQPALSERDRQFFAANALLIRKANLDRIRKSIQVALEEDPNSYGISPTLQARMPAALKACSDATEFFLSLTNRLANPEQTGLSAEEYRTAGRAAQEENFRLWRVVQEEADVLIQARIRAYQSRRNLSLLIAAGVSLVAVGLVIVITRSISDPLRRQADELRAANQALQAEVAERAHAEAELTRSEARLSLAQRAAHLGSWTQEVAADGTVYPETVRWSDALFRLYGYEPDPQANPWELFRRAAHPEDYARILLAYEESLRTGEPFVDSYRILLPDGRERIVHAESCTVPDPQHAGRLVLVGTIQDITERQQAEADRHAKEEAERANRAKSTFLSRMSHELRTPLNAILGFGQVLEFSKLPGQDGQCVQFILKAGRHLLSLVNEVLDLSRVETGELSLTMTRVPVAELAEECMGLIAKLAQPRDIRCQMEFMPPELKVHADEHRLRQVLLNLLSNAVKFNHEGGEVVLGGESRGGHLRLRISDTGPGIAAGDMGKLFVPFGRIDQTVGNVEGTGLGLVVSRRLVEAMGGALGLESEVSRGSTFWIELPLAEAAEPAGPAASGSQDVLAAESEGSEEATLLYIEDNPSNLQVVQMLLTRHRPRWKMLSAPDGTSGLAQVRRARPDMILLDLQLPDMQGDEVLMEIRTEPELREMPVVLLSADATAQTRERLLNIGANDYLSKPFSASDLLKKLDTALIGRQG